MAAMTDNMTPDHWQRIDAAGTGGTAAAYLDAAALAFTAPRIRSHQLLGVEPGATVLDVGLTRTDEGIRGDVDRSVSDIAGLLTPMPGGTGPMTIAMLLRSAVKAARYRRGLLAYPTL